MICSHFAVFKFRGECIRSSNGLLHENVLITSDFVGQFLGCLVG